ncbi:MAG: hypothetical protein ACI9HK_003351 [Pirellulaceae bacterium]|jgi:hypothetical protein
MTDLFVGLVACAIGAAALVAAIANWDSAFQLDKAQWIEERWGRSAARKLFGVIGLIMIGFGVLVAIGMAPYSWYQ